MRSSVFSDFTLMLRTNQIMTMTYHPISNGIIERFNRHLKSTLKAHKNSKWSDIIPVVLLGIRTAVKEDIHLSCAELVYGTPLRLPAGTLDTQAIKPYDDDFISNL